MFVFKLLMEPYLLFLISANFLGPVTKNFARRLVCPDVASITYPPAVHFTNMRKYPLMSPLH